MTSSKPAPAKAESLVWMERQLNELKAAGSPVYSELLDHLVMINSADQRARNALIHGKSDPQDYIRKREERLFDLEFNPHANPASEFPYLRKDGTPASLAATTLLRKFETILISERLEEAHKRVGDALKEADIRARRMKDSGLVPADNIIAPQDEWQRRASEWANTDPDQIQVDEFVTASVLDRLPAIPATPATPAAQDKWSVESVIKVDIAMQRNVARLKGNELATYMQETLIPLHKEVLAELQVRAAGDGNKNDDAHLLTFMGSVSTQIQTARAALAPAVTALPQDVAKKLAQAAIDTRIDLAEEIKAEAPRKSFAQRLGEVGTAASNLVSGMGRWLGRAADTVFSRPVRQAAAALVLGTVASTSQHAETIEPDVSAKPLPTLKTDAPSRFSGGAVTQAPVIAANFAETAAPVQTVAAVAPAVTPAPATRAAKTDFSVQAAGNQPYEAPDELSVTFNGQKLRADVFTVKAACEQIGNASSICENFVPPSPHKG